ncbi:MAG TPA: TonB-dependent receptor [Ignavibacteria bacterium]
MRDYTLSKVISLFIFVLLFFCSTEIFAQSTGSIGGLIVDAKDNSPLAGATVKIVGTNQGAITNDNGDYVILNVDVGTYDVEASYVGYDKKIQTGVRVSVDMKTKVNFELATMGGITTEIITVEAERKGIDVEQSGRVIENSTINNSGVRGITNIVAKTAGVVQDERGGAINVRGGRTNENVIIVDGVETTNPLDGTSRAFIPNNLLQEISVLTGGFGAEYGNVLSGVINVSTRSGSDKYTGSFEAITDEFTNRWIDTKSTGYNLYNVSFGGPLIPTKGLSKVINFFGSLERSFQRITIGSWILDKVPTIVPNGNLRDNENGSYSISGRLNFNLTEIQTSNIPLQLKLGATLNSSKGRVLYGSNVYNYVDPVSGNVISNSFRNPVTDNTDNLYYARLIHNVSSKFFYELQGSYYSSRAEQYDPIFGDKLTRYGDTAYNPDLARYGLTQGGNLGLDPNTAYLYGRINRVIDIYNKTDVSYLGAKLDATLALLTKNYGDHEVKFGGEYKYHTLKRLSINPGSTADLSVQNSFDRWYGTNLARLKTYGYEIVDPLTGTLIADGNDAKHPITGGFYARDKVSFADFNFNGGVRVDFLDVNTKVFRDLQNDVTGPDGIIASDDDFVDSKMNFYVSPRLGFSFPITDRSIFHAQYGKMVQLPQLNLMFVNQLTLQKFLSTALQDIIENSSLTPTKLTQYEIGFKQSIGDYINMDITAFYKESTDLIGAGRVKATLDGKVPVGFVTYMNNDFAISRGIDFYLSMRRMYRIALDVAYTLSYASGTGSDPFSKTSLANDATQELPQFVYPLDYDQRHTGSINLDYRFGGREDVPKGFLGDVLMNLGFNVLFSFNSGRPYTRAEVSTTSTGTQGSFVTSSKNELTQNWNFRLDLRVDKSVNLWKTNWNFYVYVINVLNSEIVNTIFPGTGKPDDNGFLTTETGASTYETNPMFRYLWPERIKFFTNWGPPRQIRFGVNVTF